MEQPEPIPDRTTSPRKGRPDSAPGPADAPVLGAREVSRTFPGVQALDDVDLNLSAGEVHGLVGENGAGKSTLINILAGLLPPSSGTVMLRSEPVTFTSAADSQEAGVSVISQEFQLVPQLSIAENIFLGREPTRLRRLVSWRAVRRRAAALLDDLGLEASPTTPVERLKVADQQLVEIAKALSQSFHTLIMDEPTAALSAPEVKRLFTIVKRLREDGAAVLYVSHHLPEIFEICDRVTVLRDGQRIDTVDIKDVTEADIVEMMLGRPPEAFEYEAASHRPEGREPVLTVDNLSVGRDLTDVSFEAHPGEVLGIAGLIGSGRQTLARALVGMDTPTAGRILLNGETTELSGPANALQHGIVSLAEDRKAEGIFPDLTVKENLVISAQRQAGLSGFLIRPKRELATFERLKEYLAIRAHDPEQLVPTLSGGNQQKTLLGRALATDCRLLILNEPTRGVDVGAKVEIHHVIRQLAEDGIAVIVSSSDFPEVVAVSDRCLVLSGGRVSEAIHRREHITEDRIVRAAIGDTTDMAS